MQWLNRMFETMRIKMGSLLHLQSARGGKPMEQKLDDDVLSKQLIGQMFVEISKTRRHANWRAFAVVVMFLFAFGYNYFQGGHFGIDGQRISGSTQYISLVRLRGMIEPNSPSSPESMLPVLTKAFLDENSKGVLLLINSPGGTPVQSKILFDTLMDLKKETGKRLVVLGEDSMTSGAYMVAMAGDRVYDSESGLTGSIGVFEQSWGYGELAERIGVESRVIYSGKYKRRLDPFKPMNVDDEAKMQSTMHLIHENFIGLVKSRRGNRLKASDDELFSGDFWTGTQAVKLGLVDGVSDMNTVMKREFGVTDAIDYSNRPGFLSTLGRSFGSSLQTLIEEAVPSGFTAGLNVRL